MMRAVLCSVMLDIPKRSIYTRQKAVITANIMGKAHLDVDCPHINCNKVRAFMLRKIVAVDEAGVFSYVPITKKVAVGYDKIGNQL